MTADELRELSRLAAQLADELEAREKSSAKPDRTLSTNEASRIAKRSFSSLYRDARQHGFGWKLPTGSWQFSERGLRAFLRKKSGVGEFGEFGERDGVFLAMESAQVDVN
ncbi:hypothetical protein [Methylocystis sp. ATCC 49242]|uniref:hypothetical protein n=1 Tax=Methylocystis sp. ATCC 49242 TaxID=622637 RepID=UPI001186B98F|nr:hypothetical protein [Methylocystis sp. ATCC 49242]